MLRDNRERSNGADRRNMSDSVLWGRRRGNEKENVDGKNTGSASKKKVIYFQSGRVETSPRSPALDGIKSRETAKPNDKKEG